MNTVILSVLFQILPHTVAPRIVESKLIENYYPNEQLYCRIEQDSGWKKVVIYYEDGKLWAKGKLNANQEGKGQEFSIWYPNGQLSRYYHEDEGLYTEYDEQGRLLKKMYREHVHRITEEYYYSKQLKSKEISRIDKDLGVCPYYPIKLNKSHPPMMYVCRHIAYHFREEFYPDGKVLQRIEYQHPEDGQLWIYKHLFFHPDGSLDTSTYGFNHKMTGKIRTYHLNGELKSIGTYNEGRAIGIIETFNEKGIRISQVNYNSTFALDSFATYWYDDGSPKMQRWYRNGYAVGPMMEWYEDRTPKLQGSNGYGITVTYSSDGKEKNHEINFPAMKPSTIILENLRIERDHTENNMREGRWRGYFDNNQLAFVCDYKNNKMDGILKVYGRNGLLVIDAEFKNGFIHGKAIVKNNKGIIIYNSNFENGKLRGLSYQYYDNGDLYRKQNYVNDHTVYTLEEYDQEKNVIYNTIIDSTAGVMIISHYSNTKLKVYDFTYSYRFHPLRQRTYFPNGKLRTIIFYTETGEQGERIYYNEDGTVRNEYLLKSDAQSNISFSEWQMQKMKEEEAMSKWKLKKKRKKEKKAAEKKLKEKRPGSEAY